MNNKITKILAEEIKDSNGNPTLEVSVFCGDVCGSFAVPSGASTGSHEAHELRDLDGKGVKQAIRNVNEIIAPALLGHSPLDQKDIDEMLISLDGTKNKDSLGGNAMIGVSIACAKVSAKILHMETFEYLRTLIKIKPSRKTPYLFMNLLEGGKHTKSGLSFQEYHIVPNVSDVSEAIEIGVTMVECLRKKILKELGENSLSLGDEGGFAPEVSDIRKPLLLLKETAEENYLDKKVRFALDVASSSFYNSSECGGNGGYFFNQKFVSAEDMLKLYGELAEEFGIFSIEDPFFEEDFSNFKNLRSSLKDIFVVGDDLTVSNIYLLKKAVKNKSINAMIIKPNQIGTLSETLLTMQFARKNNIELIVSHRGRETDDDFIADLAYAFGCFGLKAGAPTKPERKKKYDRLLKIYKM